MRFRTLLILVIALVLLVGLLLATRVSENSTRKDSLLGVAEDRVTRLEMHPPGGDMVALVRDGDRWRVEPGDFPADASRVAYALTTVTQLASKGVISDNPQKADLFGVTEEKALVVELYTSGDQPAARAYLGKVAPATFDAYFRLEGSDEVHEVDGGVRHVLSHDRDNWRDRVMWAFDPATIGRVELSGAVNRVLEREEGGPWRWAEGPQTAPDDAKVNRMLESLTAQRASGFVDDAPPLEAAQVVNLVPFGEGEPLRISVAREESGGLRVATSAKDQQFKAVAGALGSLMDDVDALFAPGPQSAAPAMEPAMPAGSPPMPPSMLAPPPS